jgi:hypothetical protein
LRGRAELTLNSGDRLLLDYLGAGESVAAGCNAVGMGLEVGLEPQVPTNQLADAELWLVRFLPNGIEETQRLLVRLQVGGAAAPFFFNAVTLKPLTFWNDSRPSTATEEIVLTSGELAVAPALDGKVLIKFSLTRKHGPADADGRLWADKLQGGTTTYRDVMAMAGDVLEWKLPPISVSAVPDAALQIGQAKSQLTKLKATGKTDEHPEVKAWRLLIARLEEGERFSVRLRLQLVK